MALQVTHDVDHSVDNGVLVDLLVNQSCFGKSADIQ